MQCERLAGWINPKSTEYDTPQNNTLDANNPMQANRTQPSVSEKRPLVAQKIAKDLYNFMLSFDTGGARGSQAMTVPANIFDRWWKRFEAKLNRDPNFFLKNNND